MNKIIARSNKFLRHLNAFIKADKKINFPKKNDILIFDRNSYRILEKYVLGHANYEILDVRYESINLSILLKVLFSKKRYDFVNSYFDEYIKKVQPKYIITFIDNGLNRSFDYDTSIKFYVFQNGIRDNTFNFNKKIGIKYYFAQSRHITKQVEKNFDAEKIYSLGSIINNSFCKVKIQPVRKIQWVSQFRRNRGYISLNEVKVSYHDYNYKADNFCLSLIYEFLKETGFELEILSSSGSIDEIEYFESILGKDFKLIPKKKSNSFQSNYSQLSPEAIVVGVDSTLLYEAFGRAFRVCFFSVRNTFISNPSYRFGWPFNFEDTGDFWSSVPDKQSCLNVLKYLSKVRQEEWDDILNDYSCIMGYDYQNETIKGILRNDGMEVY